MLMYRIGMCIMMRIKITCTSRVSPVITVLSAIRWAVVCAWHDHFARSGNDTRALGGGSVEKCQSSWISTI